MPSIINSEQQTITLVAGHSPLRLHRKDIAKLLIEPPAQGQEGRWELWIVLNDGVRVRFKTAQDAAPLKSTAEKLSTSLGGDLKIVGS